MERTSKFGPKKKPWRTPQKSRRHAPRTNLVGGIEKGNVLLFRNQRDDLLPLVNGRIAARGVVRAGVQQHDGGVGRLVQVLQQSLQIERVGRLVVVPVALHLETGFLENGNVVAPRGIWRKSGFGKGREKLS